MAPVFLCEHAMPSKRSPLRRLQVVDEHRFFPAYVVWELTLRCDQPCAHCGSRAGKARDVELSREEALDVVQQLRDMGALEVVLIGGEAYLHDAFIDVIAALKAAGIRPTMTTGGQGITAELAAQMKAAGLYSVSVSVDGLEAEHNAIRLAKGSHEGALRALRLLRAAGIPTSANTNVNRVNVAVLEDLYDALKAEGIKAWQVQVTIPLGRAADRPQMLLQPYDLLDVVPRVAALKERGFKDGILVMPGNNLGYFGPEEGLLRSALEGGSDHWQSCQAGRRVMGIESDGAVKGCPSLQTAHYVGGNLKERSLDDIWANAPQMAFTRGRDTESLWGFCAECPYAEVCLGGCTFSAHAVLGRPGNNPYCHYRALEMKRRGLRERLVPAQAASGLPFDNGTFDVVVEGIDANEDAAPVVTLRQLTKVSRRPLNVLA